MKKAKKAFSIRKLSFQVGNIVHGLTDEEMTKYARLMEPATEAEKEEFGKTDQREKRIIAATGGMQSTAVNSKGEKRVIKGDNPGAKDKVK